MSCNVIRIKTQTNYRFGRCVDNRLRTNRRCCGINKKVITQKVINASATTLFTEWLDTGPVVLLRKGFGSISRLVKIIAYSLSF